MKNDVKLLGASKTAVLRLLLVVFSFLFIGRPIALAQKVGVVLSGGGATAMVHLGFLKYLEEQNIPIDYIGGTSMGAMIGAMYAAGYSIEEMDSLVHSPEFQMMAEGELDVSMKFYYLQSDPDASAATLKYKKGQIISNALPTNLINPVLMDWKLMEGLSQADAAAKYQFDSLFIPFRCIAANVEKKQEVVFRDGSLNLAVRASSTYPFYLPPRRINGDLLYDGGIYNNFPINVVYQDFMPDVILGCNVSGEAPSPQEEDIFSQLQAMIMFRDPITNPCENVVVVRPDVQSIGTFDFDKISEAIRAGYLATADSIEVIKALIDRRVTAEERAEKRKLFRKKFKPLVVEEILVDGVDKSQKSYIHKMMGRRQGDVPLSSLKEPYFRVFADEKVQSVFPMLTYNSSTGKYKMNFEIQKEKDLFLSFGGNFSSRSINTGFVGLRYNLFRKSAATLDANSYFGRFYGSLHVGLRWDIASRSFPINIETSYTQNRWDYYKSLSAFFEDVKPSFILLNERFGNLAVNMRAGNQGKIRAEASYLYLFDQYYQTNQFLSVDTADRTDFTAGIFRVTYDRNTLNRIQYADKGTKLLISLKYVVGQEITIPGSTSVLRDSTTNHHEWIVGKLSYTNFFLKKGFYRLGFNAEGVASTQDFFNNYISSSIAAPAYQPIVESSTFFMAQFRAHSYAAGGLINVFEMTKNFHLRLEGYVFNAFGQITKNEFGKPIYNWKDRPYGMASGALVYHSPLGPVSVSANYYDQKERPWSVLFNFGYIIFNRSARD